MKKNNPATLRILLAEDDAQDRFFFGKALRQLAIKTLLETADSGESLMNYLEKNEDNLPDILFLDLRMPGKNGFQCMEEIKANIKLQRLVIVIFSDSYYYDDFNFLYQKGAHCYVKKPHYPELKEFLSRLFTLLASMKFEQPAKADFIFGAESL